MSFIERIRERQRVKAVSRGEYGYELAALHLRLLVAMAAADDELLTVEVEELAIFVERVKVSDEDRVRLDELLRLLIDAPPELDSMLRQLVEFDQGHGVAELLVADLASIAKVDANIDHREETLLRMVCGAFGIAPRTLHAREMRAATEVETEELRQLVHALVAR